MTATQHELAPRGSIVSQPFPVVFSGIFMQGKVSTYSKRSNFVTTTGYHVAVMPDTGLVRIVTSPDRAFTTKTTQNIITQWLSADNPVMSACIAVDNSLHVAYRDDPSKYTLKYAKLTWNGNGYNAPTIVTLQAYDGAGTVPRSIDIDTAGTAAHKWTVIGVYYTNIGNKTAFANYYVIDDTTATVYPSLNHSIATNKVATSDSVDLTLACAKDQNGSTTTSVRWAVVYTRSWDSGDIGDKLDTWSFDTSTHGFIPGAAVGISSAGKGSGRRNYMIFCKDGEKIFYVIGGGTPDWWYSYKFEFTSTNSITSITPQSVSTTGHPNTTFDNAHIYLGFAFNGDNKCFIIGCTNRTPYIIEIAAFNDDDTISWYGTATQFAYMGGDGQFENPARVCSGGNRNFDTQLGSLVWYSVDDNDPSTDPAILYAYLLLAQGGAVTKPSAGSTQATSYLTLEAKYLLRLDAPQVRYKMLWQIASDSGFTTDLFTYLQPDSQLLLPNNTFFGHADVRALSSGVGRVASGSWYIRAAAVDDAGNQGDWSSTYSFSILHRPQASNLAPDNDTIVPYGDGSVFFSWEFSDPSPGDDQTAYEIIVTNASDGSTVADSGKVSTDAKGGVAVIPAGSKDTELRWQVFVYDTDDTIASPGSALATFISSDPPAPVITSPAEDAELTTGRPTIVWTAGISSGKTQDAYRVQISQGSVMIFNTGWIEDSVATSYQIPAGILHNLNSYAIRVVIRDSLGQQGVASIYPTTNYVQPATPEAIEVYEYEFDRYGFVYVGWSANNVDDAFIGWNLYRQEIGSPDIILLSEFTELRPTYGFRDYSAKANTRYRYWITQSVNRSGDIVESEPSPTNFANTPSGHYWLLDASGVADPVPLFNATADTWTDEHDEAVINVLGRGRHVDTGTKFGDNGSLTIQFRDKFTGLPDGSNWLLNPAMQYATDGINPDNWLLSSENVTGNLFSRYDTFIEPSPSVKSQVFIYACDAFDATGVLIFSNEGSEIEIADTDLIPGVSEVFASFWTAQPPEAIIAVTRKISYTWLDSSDAVVASGQVDADLIETYEPSNSGDFGTGNWFRYGHSIACPAGAAKLRVEYRIANNSGATNPITVYFGGGQVNSGADPISYFDGDMPGANWVSVIGGASFATGNYSARRQRMDMENMRDLSRPLYLRSPFGDITLVSLGDSSNNRIAGVGEGADFADVTVPYREIAY